MPFSNIQPVVGQDAAKYKYYTVDIVSNTIVGEIPFEDVVYERALKAAGSFSGKITTSQDTENLDLYNSTMPGKTALYVVRNEECVWGGIIWGRTYDMLGRSLSITASEFTSYLSHRLIWKTNTRSFTADLTSPSVNPTGIFRVNLTSGSLREAPAVFDSNGVRNTVYITMPDASLYQYNGYYDIVGTGTSGVGEDPTTSSFYVRIPNLPVAKNAKRVYNQVSITTKADTYEYIRSLITEAFSDFSSIDFANELIEPGVKIPTTVETKKLEITDSTHGVATLTTKTNHNLVTGEQVLLANIDPLLDGEHTISEVPSKRSFKITLDNPVSAYDKKTILTLTNIPTTDVTSSKTLIKRREKVFNMERSIKRISRTNGVVTLTLHNPHTYVKGQKVIVTIPKKAPWKKTIDGKETDLFNYGSDTGLTITSVDLTTNSLTFNELETKYNSSTYNITANVPVADKNITYVKLATPETKLRLTPLDGIGFVRGDYVKVAGVDDLEWPNPVYNGFVTVDESSYGLPNEIASWQLTNTLDDTSGFLSLYFDNLPDTFDDPNGPDQLPNAEDLAPNISTIEPLAEVLITGLDPRFDNQVWQTEGGAYPDGPTGLWRVNFLVPYLSTSSSIVSAPAGATATVNGTKWFQYYPSYSRAIESKEPDSVNGIAAIKYSTPTAVSKYGKLTIWTVGTHKYNIGDGVEISFADEATKKLFDGVRTVVAVGANDDGNNDSVSFNYVVPTENAPQAITTKTTKSGTLTRKSALLTPPKIEMAAVTDISTEGKLATVSTFPAHPFLEGDYVVISTPIPEYASFTNNGEPVKIVSTPSEYEFQYITEGKADPEKIANVKAINTSADGSTITITTGGVSDQVIAPRTYNIEYVENSSNALYLAYIHLDQNHGAEIGEKVTVSGLPAATYSTPTNIPASTKSIVGMVSNYGNLPETLTITFASAHGWNRSDIDKYPSITLGGLSSSSDFTYWDQKTYPAVWRRSQSSVVLQAEGSRASLTSNVVTMYTRTAHGFKAGDSVFVDGLYPFHGTYTILSTPTTSTFTYARTASNKALASTYAFCTATRLFDVKMNLSVYNGTYKIVDIPSDNQIVIPFTPRSSIPDWWISSADASGSVSFPAVTGISEQLTPNYSLLNGVTSVYDIGGSTALNKLFLSSSALETNKEILDGDPGAGTIEFAGKIKSIANTTPHGLAVGDTIAISGLGGYYDTNIGTYVPLNMLNATHKILSKTDTTFTITSPLSKAANGYQTYIVNKEFTMDEFTSGVIYKPLDVTGMLAYRDHRRTSPANVKRITSISRKSDGTGALVTAPGHGLSDDDFVYINAYGSTGGIFNQGNRPIVISNTTTDTFEYDFYPPSATNIDRVTVSKNKATLYTAYGTPHAFFKGDTITLSNFPGGVYGTAFNGNTFIIQNVGYDRIVIATTGLADRKTPITLATYGQVDFASGGIVSVSANGGTVTIAPTASKEPVVFRRTYGGFPDNADMGGIEFSTENYSTYKQASQTIRGSQLVNLGGHLEQYSSSINGFDYRIDCKLEKDAVTNNYKFKRIFTLVPILPASYTEYLEKLNYPRQDPLTLEVGLGLAPGQVADPIAFGADKIVFEYPGNISNVSVAENSESSATRVFITGTSNGEGGEGNVRYSAASATDLLAAGWPLLDRAESQSWPLLTKEGAVNVDSWGNYDIEIDLYKTAKRFLYESKPPIGDFTITVNGSMNPVVGTFNPGDWCSLNINDAFVKSRLASALELRKNVIVRKIDSISVSVPNNPAFPEQVNLTLVTDWQVDKVGE